MATNAKNKAATPAPSKVEAVAEAPKVEETTTTATVEVEAPDTPEDSAPVSAPPVARADQRILSIAFTIMSEFSENGATVEELCANIERIGPKEMAQLLRAMEHAEAAVKTTSDGEPDRWKLGTTKASLVDPANLPQCPTCGEYPTIIRPGTEESMAKRASNGNGGTGKVNADGKPALKPRELWPHLHEYIDAHPGKLSPTVISNDISAKLGQKIGTGSIGYALNAMVDAGELDHNPTK